MLKLVIKKLPKLLRKKRNLAEARDKALIKGAERMLEMIDDYIDSGRAFKPRTGHLQRSIAMRPTKGAVVISANAEYAPFVEFGTKAHVIKPKRKKALAFPKGSRRVIVRKVNHPGSKPYPFFYADWESRTREVQRVVIDPLLEELNG